MIIFMLNVQNRHHLRQKVGWWLSRTGGKEGWGEMQLLQVGLEFYLGMMKSF